MCLILCYNLTKIIMRPLTEVINQVSFLTLHKREPERGIPACHAKNVSAECKLDRPVGKLCPTHMNTGDKGNLPCRW